MNAESVHFLTPGDAEQNINEVRLELNRAQVQEFDGEQLLTYITQLETAWSLNKRNDPWIPFRSSFNQFFGPEDLNEEGLPRDLDIEKVFDKNQRRTRVLGEMLHRAKALDIDTEDTTDVNGDEFQVIARINRLIEMADDSYEIVLRYARQYERINHPSMVCVDPASDNTLFRCSTMNTEDITPYQSLILTMLTCLSKYNIRRYKGQCCKQIITADGFQTRAWKRCADFVTHRRKRLTR